MNMIEAERWKPKDQMELIEIRQMLTLAEFTAILQALLTSERASAKQIEEAQTNRNTDIYSWKMFTVQYSTALSISERTLAFF